MSNRQSNPTPQHRGCENRTLCLCNNVTVSLALSLSAKLLSLSTCVSPPSIPLFPVTFISLHPCITTTISFHFTSPVLLFNPQNPKRKGKRNNMCWITRSRVLCPGIYENHAPKHCILENFRVQTCRRAPHPGRSCGFEIQRPTQVRVMSGPCRKCVGENMGRAEKAKLMP